MDPFNNIKTSSKYRIGDRIILNHIVRMVTNVETYSYGTVYTIDGIDRYHENFLEPYPSTVVRKTKDVDH